MVDVVESVSKLLHIVDNDDGSIDVVVDVVVVYVVFDVVTMVSYLSL